MLFTGSVTILLSGLDGAQKRAQRHSPRTLINAHSPWLPARFTSFPGLPCSRVLVYRLSILPENISTFEAQTCRGCREKRLTRICGQRTDGQTDRQTHAHTHTHRLSAITLARACAARVNNTVYNNMIATSLFVLVYMVITQPTKAVVVGAFNLKHTL